ncbi:hypothetical protein LC612_25880 [Nostoc sp. CHAB 5834]|nr:hypothetical protein [Nostoc sp. CHAB 5834]
MPDSQRQQNSTVTKSIFISLEDANYCTLITTVRCEMAIALLGQSSAFINRIRLYTIDDRDNAYMRSP